MLTSRLDTYNSRYGDFCANDDNDDETTDHFTPCTCPQGNKLNLSLSIDHMRAVSRNTCQTDGRQVLCAGRLSDFLCHQEQEGETEASEPK